MVSPPVHILYLHGPGLGTTDLHDADYTAERVLTLVMVSVE